MVQMVGDLVTVGLGETRQIGVFREVLTEEPYAIEAGDALAKVHERGVIHRDLKPENLLIARDGYLKIIDFGLAKLADPLAQSGLADAATIVDDRVRTAEGVVMGTVGYMSPEQVRGEPVDARSDIFSFGAVLYEMVTGTAPFRKKSAAETISAILNEMPPAPRVEDVVAGTELQRIVRKCFAKEPGSRYQGMRDLVVDLRDLRNTTASSESVARLAQPALQPSPGWRQPRTLAIGAMLVATLMVAAFLLISRRESTAIDRSADAVPARPAVAVVPFEVMGGNQETAWLGKGLPAMLITGLVQTPDIEVIGGERLTDAARQAGAPDLDAVERSQLAALARRAGARFVLNGTIVQAGGDLRIDARIEDLETGAVRLAESVRGADALALADDLAERVRRGFDVAAAPGAVKPVADISTASVDAYRAYLAGLEAEFNLRFGDARTLFQEAVQIDPGFGLAYYHLSTVATFGGRISESLGWLQRAEANLDRMPEREAMMVRAELARTAGRDAEADRLLEDVVRRYPDMEVAWLRLGFSAYFVDPQYSHAVFERATAALPHSAGLLNMLGYTQLAVGRVEEALRSFEAYVKLRPSEGNALDSLAEGQLVAGRPEEAIATFQAALKGGYQGGVGGTALSLGVMGRYDEALADPQATGGTLRALLLSRVGRYREAEQALESTSRPLSISSRLEAPFRPESSGWVAGTSPGPSSGGI